MCIYLGRGVGLLPSPNNCIPSIVKARDQRKVAHKEGKRCGVKAASDTVVVSRINIGMIVWMSFHTFAHSIAFNLQPSSTPVEWVSYSCASRVQGVRNNCIPAGPPPPPPPAPSNGNS